MASMTFGVRTSQRGKPVIAKDPKDRVSSFSFSDAELRHATVEAIHEARGTAALSRGNVGDIARGFFGQVVR